MGDHSVQSVIHSVVKKKSIVDYLERKGYQPVKTLAGGKLLYLCPFPDHSESKPSFVVYTQAEYENFHCFGCQRHHSIIHLMAGLEGITFKESLSRLSDGMDINYLEGVDLEMKRIDKEYIHPFSTMQTSEEMMSISNMGRMYLDNVGNDPSESALIDKLFASVDKDIKDLNFDSISETARVLPVILQKRREKFEQKKLEKMRQEHARQ